jgi:Protein of unknown function (DUF3224)
MSAHANATFEIKNWDEKTWEGRPYNEVSGAKLTRASVAKSFQGDIAGESTLEYLMSYHENGTVSFVGLERVVGSVGGRNGSFVLQRIGADEGGVLKETYFVVPGSGTGDLRGLRGEGSATLGEQADRYPFTLDYDFE